MADIQHSRLLKIILPSLQNRPTMEPYKIKVNVPDNPKIKSETPGEQKLREDFFVQNQEENSSSEDSFSPVFKMTKQETSFTKGDHKVQKVFIKQDVADGSSRYLIEIPSNPNIQSATIEKPHLIRLEDQNDQNYEDLKNEKENKVILPPPKSKIPRLADKLKHIVDQMKYDGITTEKNNSAKGNSSASPSSIPQPLPRAPPRLKRIQRTKVNDNLGNNDKNNVNHDKNNDNHNKKYDNHGKINDIHDKTNEAKINPEEEFDKLFEEIVDKEPSPVIVDKVLNVRPDSITDVKFEQIIHDYDTNKLKPIFIDEQSLLNKSKIPLLKRKSEGNIKVSGYLELFEKKSQNSDKRPERKNKETKRFNCVNETISQNNEEVILRRKKAELSDDKANKIEDKKANKESKIPLLKQVSNESIKYPGIHRRASLKKSISLIDNNRGDLKENEVSNEQTFGEDEQKEVNQKIVDNDDTGINILREENVLKVSTDIYRKTEVEEKKVSDHVKVTESNSDAKVTDIIKGKEAEKTVANRTEAIKSNRFKNDINEGSQKDKDETKFLIHKLRLKYEKLSRENSQEQLFEERIKSSHVIEDETHIQKREEENEYDNSKIMKDNIVFSMKGIQKSNALNYVSNQNKSSKRDTEEKPESFENDGSRTPLNELRKKFEYLSRENSQETIKRAGNVLVAYDIEPSDEKNEIVKVINKEKSTERHKKLKEINNIYKYEATNINFKETKPKNKDDEKRIQITDLLQKFRSLSRENSFIDSHEENKEKEDLSSMNEGEDVEGIEEIDVLELRDAVEVEIETLIADLGDDDHDDDDFGEIKLKDHVVGVSNEKLTPKNIVLAKMELFERQSSKETPLNLNSPSHQYEKPKIVEEVLKTPIMQRKQTVIDENVIKPHFNRITEIPIHNTATTINIGEKNLKKDQFIIKNDKLIKVHNDNLHKNISNFTRQDSKSFKTIIEFESIPASDKKQKYNANLQENKDTFTGHNLVNDRKTRFENNNIEVKVKEADDKKISKDKVNSLVYRIGSMESLLVDGGTVIPPKERPRRNSVSEKIALFERKLTVFNMDDPVKKINITTDASATTNEKLTQRSHTMPKDKDNDGKTANNHDAELNEKLEEFKNAKQKYGSFDHMSYFKLNSGDKMPVIALGTALLDPTVIRPIIEAAIDLGYRAFDSAFIYGNERDVGEAIRNKIQDGTVKREELFISSKLWSTFHRPDLVVQACQTTLDNLGLEYLDLFMIHNPMSLKEGPDPIPMIANVLQYSEYDYMDAWYAMEGLLETGKVKNIGVSNFNSEQLKKILDKGKVKPVVNQVESHPYLSQERLKAFCDTHRIQLQCYGVLGSIGTPKEYKSPDFKVALEDALVKVMASGLTVTPAQLLISYQLRSGRAVVVKASSADRLWTNLQALELQLTEEQIKALNAMNTNTRNFLFTGMGDTHKNYPFNIPY